MNIRIFSEIFDRDLLRLKEEISLYGKEGDLWKTCGEIKNPAGNLALHLIGNLNFFIGATLGNTGYERNREAEFSMKNVSKEILLGEIESAREMLKKILLEINDEDLSSDFPAEFLGKKRSVSEVLLILITHLNYHLGQVNYHRRMISGK